MFRTRGYGRLGSRTGTIGRGPLPRVTLQVPAWFDLRGLRLGEPLVEESRFVGELEEREISEILGWVRENRREICGELRQRLLSVYMDRKPHTNKIKAEEFFGRVGTRYSLRLGLVDGCPLVFAEKT